MPSLAQVVAVLEELYDPAWAQPWDAVGLVCGDPDAEVRRVLLAVDPVLPVAEEAVGWGAQLVLTHHPLFLRPVHGVPATTPKGRILHRLLTAGVALHVAHTNADVAAPGVSDALAAALGLRDVRPLEPDPVEPLDKIVTFVPDGDVDRVIDALAGAGAGRIGAYSRCAWTTSGTGTFRPERGAQPALGEVGRVERVAEGRVEMVLPRTHRRSVLAALRASHPYEEPAFDLLELAGWPGARGLGRVGELAAGSTLGDLVDAARGQLPETAGGVRVAGELGAPVRTVAVCGGAGDGLFEAVRRCGAEAYLTADLRHHPAAEAREHGDPALVDVSHWASEWPWLHDAARRLVTGLAGIGATVETRVSTTVTDPWTSASAQLQRSPT